MITNWWLEIMWKQETIIKVDQILGNISTMEGQHKEEIQDPQQTCLCVSEEKRNQKKPKRW